MKEIEKLDEGFYDNIEVIGVNGCLHRRDAKLLELVKKDFRKKLNEPKHSGCLLNDEVDELIISVIDKLKEAINGEG
jgi:hypothetical protein